jgi:polysaccharide export outer membrane protein
MRKTSLLALVSMLSGCVVGPAPRNVAGSAWMPTQSPLVSPCPVRADTPSSRAIAALPADLISPGDRVRVLVAGDADRLSGVYVIDAAGRLLLPGVQPVVAEGHDGQAVERVLRDHLIAAQMIRPLAHAVSVLLIDAAPVDVAVSGAVFQAGMTHVGEREPTGHIGQREGVANGDRNAARTLMAALRAAGGVRPDADVAAIKVFRGATELAADLRGALSGGEATDLPLYAGDRVVVPTSGCFSAALARPSAITPAGVRVYMSNLTRPANNNAGAAVGKESTSLPYGTRFLQALASMNCVGGSAINAGRRAVLISRNPMTGRSIVVERSIEDLVRGADRDDHDPVIMPDDAIACYDSRWSNLQDALGLLGTAASIATPAILLRKTVK